MKEGLDAQQCEPLSVRGGFRGVRSDSAELHLVDGKWLAGVVEARCSVGDGVGGAKSVERRWLQKRIRW